MLDLWRLLEVLHTSLAALCRYPRPAWFRPCVLPLRTLFLENGEDGALGGGFHAGAVGFCKGACV